MEPQHSICCSEAFQGILHALQLLTLCFDPHDLGTQPQRLIQALALLSLHDHSLEGHPHVIHHTAATNLGNNATDHHSLRFLRRHRIADGLCILLPSLKLSSFQVGAQRTQGADRFLTQSCRPLAHFHVAQDALQGLGSFVLFCSDIIHQGHEPIVSIGEGHEAFVGASLLVGMTLRCPPPVSSCDLPSTASLWQPQDLPVRPRRRCCQALAEALEGRRLEDLRALVAVRAGDHRETTQLARPFIPQNVAVPQAFAAKAETTHARALMRRQPQRGLSPANAAGRHRAGMVWMV
mmetsp:Transcript_88280/g.140388  ORF Transcript_88280/g.140388 Transcript_88280/m.140388 type:complete len:293 (-) Transcript_88280:13-891(-)